MIFFPSKSNVLHGALYVLLKRVSSRDISGMSKETSLASFKRAIFVAYAAAKFGS